VVGSVAGCLASNTQLQNAFQHPTQNPQYGFTLIPQATSDVSSGNWQITDGASTYTVAYAGGTIESIHFRDSSCFDRQRECNGEPGGGAGWSRQRFCRGRSCTPRSALFPQRNGCDCVRREAGKSPMAFTPWM